LAVKTCADALEFVPEESEHLKTAEMCLEEVKIA